MKEKKDLADPGHTHLIHQPMAALAGAHTYDSDEEKSAIQSFKGELVDDDGREVPSEHDLATLNRVADDMP
jgi:hypothetical protein